MKNLEKWIVISSLCVSSFACADYYGYNQYPQYSNDMNNSYPIQQQGYYQSSQPYGQSGQYQESGNYGSGYGARDQRYSSNQTRGYQDRPAADQSNWSSNWFGNDDKTPKVPDEVITRRAMQNLRSTPYFSNSAKNIQVMTKDGEVTLKGKAANSNEKNQIEYMVKNIEGVSSVSNDLETEK